MDHAALDLDFLTVFCDEKHESPCQQKINIREFQRLTCIVHIYLFKWSIIINMLSVTTTNYYSKLRWLLERIAYLPPILGSRSLVWTWLRSHGLFHPCKTWRSYTLMPDPTNTPPGFGKWSSCLIAQCPLLRVKIPLPGSVYTSLVRWTAKIMFVDKWWICGWLMLITYIYIYTSKIIIWSNPNPQKTCGPERSRWVSRQFGAPALYLFGGLELPRRFPNIMGDPQ